MKPQIPSPLPFLAQLPDQRNPERIDYDQEVLWSLVITALLAAKKNVLDMTQWLQDNQGILCQELSIRKRNGQIQVPSQATIYRFLWQLETQLEVLEALLLKWVKEVLKTMNLSDERISVNLDGKYLLGTKRKRSGERAYVMLGAFIAVIGVMLTQKTVERTETQTVKQLLSTLKNVFQKDTWIVTMDAGITEQDLGKRIVKAGGAYLMQIKKNQFEAFEMMHWIFHYPIASTGTSFTDTERRSGETWSWSLQTSDALPDGLKVSFPNAIRAIRLERTVLHFTGETTQEIAFALTSTDLSAEQAYRHWRGHWGIENRSHHKRDTVFAEDACRTRLAGRGLSSIRNMVLSLLHLASMNVLRSTRRFSSQPLLALKFLRLGS
jgi:predicted transposase YbfD/YdcC